ncbi:carbohydrate-binding module family 48 protein [Aspergillus lucknowensis]|uniref:AMP-activated protein kinase glycogen-binding domain-containing protein n=1 Tax=Aspergillus lucknowensis TaxID=176173 RepID=A0ABR4LUW9_9EURO
MGSYTFRWPYNANEVFVTGTFDDWGKTIKLDRKGDIFEKEVRFSAIGEKLHFKFVVDGIWTTDNRLPEEDDGSSNINNILYPDQIQEDSAAALQNDTGMSTLAGVAPTSTTAGLTGGVSKESSKTATPGFTTAGLDRDVPLEQRANVPGGFPAESPYAEYSVNPIPASSGISNPIHLEPGEKVPDPSTFNPNTVQSTARTGKAAYDQPASSANPGVTLQSAAPTSTTTGLTANVPLESQKDEGTSVVPAEDVPKVVKESFSKAHRDPEAAANEEVVEEKKVLEHELQQKVHVDNSAGTPAPTATAATTGAAPRASTAEPGSAQLSPRTTTPTGPSGAGAANAEGSAKETTKGDANPTNNTTSQVPSAGSAGKEAKKKKRSSILAKLKEKFK